MRKHLKHGGAFGPKSEPLGQSYRYVCPSGGGLELWGGTNYSMQCELRVKSFLWVLQMLAHYLFWAYYFMGRPVYEVPARPIVPLPTSRPSSAGEPIPDARKASALPAFLPCR